MSLCAAAAALCAAAADGKTLAVGADLDLKTPSAAARIAADGDTIEIAAGEYYDCAVWTAANLTIVGQDGATSRSATSPSRGRACRTATARASAPKAGI
jgi:hypothetical protein